MKKVVSKKSIDNERVAISDSCFIFTGIKKSDKVSDADMIGQRIFHGKTPVGIVMDQYDGKTLVAVDAKVSFIIANYKSGQISGKDLKTHMRVKNES